MASLQDGNTAQELIPKLARHGLQQRIALAVAAVLAAERHERHERHEERSGCRNGSRPRSLTTRMGDIPLSIPKLGDGSFLPTILEPRRLDSDVQAAIMEAWVKGVFTRRPGRRPACRRHQVDALVAAIGSETGLSRLAVSRLCQGLDAINRHGDWARGCWAAPVPLSWPWE